MVVVKRCEPLDVDQIRRRRAIQQKRFVHLILQNRKNRFDLPLCNILKNYEVIWAQCIYTSHTYNINIPTSAAVDQSSGQNSEEPGDYDSSKPL